jgi:hypothetical protein
MKRVLLLSLAALLAGSGCIIVSNGSASGDITFNWSFQGASCNQVPDVAKVRITIPGETLDNAGVFPCLVDGFPGVRLNNFRPGTYTFTVEGMNSADYVVFSKTGSVVVNGDVTVNVNLDEARAETSYAYLTWSFPALTGAASPTCAQTGVAHVDVSFDGATAVRYPCVDGQTSGGAVTPYLSSGTHSISLTAVTVDNYPLYAKQGTLVTTVGVPSAQGYALDWAVGGVTVGWSLSAASVAQSCASADLTNVYVNFQDAAGNWVYGQTGDEQACATTSVSYNYLKPGSYRVYVAGRDLANRLYEPASTNNLPTVTVQAGAFPTTPFVIALVRK